MKILILGFAKLKYMPYLDFYLNNLSKEKNEVHVLYWNRDCRHEEGQYSEITYHEFKLPLSDDSSKLNKIINFLKYRRYALKIIKKEKFDFLICMHTFPAVLLYDILMRKFYNKYIFDYRDSTYEKYKFFNYIINNIVRYSKYTFLSSPGFKKFFYERNSNKIYISHNLLIDSLEHRDDKINFGKKSDKIRIAFWGFIRGKKINEEIVRKIADDNRFELHYYGKKNNTEIYLKKIVRENKIKNVFFHGEYVPEDRYSFILNTDIIHNVYDDENAMIAMGNKYYDGIIFRIPQICMINSFMGNKVKEKSLGISCSPYEVDFLNRLYEYYTSINIKLFQNSCDVELKSIIKEYNDGINILNNIDNK